MNRRQFLGTMVAGAVGVTASSGLKAKAIYYDTSAELLAKYPHTHTYVVGSDVTDVSGSNDTDFGAVHCHPVKPGSGWTDPIFGHKHIIYNNRYLADAVMTFTGSDTPVQHTQGQF